jgi:3-deoxy-D-manno-octulosonic-acid transferase
MTLSTRHRLLLSLYGAAWRLCRPLLARHRRLRHGFDERLAPRGRTPQADLWIQSASVGESYLAWQLLRHLPQGSAGSVLLTTCTVQGRGILDSAAAWCAEHRPDMRVEVRFFPLDEPAVMRRALQLTGARAVVLLETELWPALMAACAQAGVPYVVVNGRMTPGSLAGYLNFDGFLRAVPPAAVLAMSEHDAARYAVLFGHGRVRVMPNIKFDRVPQGAAQGPNPLLGTVFRPGTSVAVLASVRREEEEDAEYLLRAVAGERPRTCIALVPRHLERVARWRIRLDEAGMPWVLRSAVREPVAPGTVVLWDAFGELDHVYALARGVFVGGSLRPLGGQNFLEPLAHGIVPVIGPHWSNFYWVGDDIMEQGLVQRTGGPEEAAQELLRLLRRPAPKTRVAARFAGYVEKRRGGARMAAETVAEIIRS